MKKRRPLIIALFVALLFLSYSVLYLRDKRDQTRKVCDTFMSRFSPPFAPSRISSTFFLDRHPTAGEWIGFSPGWIIEYKDLGPGSGVTYYVSLSGKVIHSEPMDWMGALETWKRAENNVTK